MRHRKNHEPRDRVISAFILMSYIRVISTLGCPDLTLDQVFALASRHRIAAVELRSLAGTLNLPDYFAQTERTPDKLAARLRHATIKINSLATSFKLIGSTAADREALLRFVPWAEALDVPWLRVFDGGEKAGTVEFAEAGTTLQWWRALRKKYRWQTELMVETHDSLLTGQMIQQFLAVAPDARIRWDSHHTWKKGGESPVRTWRAISDWVVSIDIKDSISRPSDRHAWTYVLPGKGEFPMPPLQKLLEAEFAGPVSFEWEKLWHPYLPELDDALGIAAKVNWW
jgi:sugar phosphate isomerase/epimerase